MTESDYEGEVPGKRKTASFDARKKKIEKKENEKIVNVDDESTGEKEGADDFVPCGNDAGGVGNDAGVGTVNVPAQGDEKQGSGEGKKPRK